MLHCNGKCQLAKKLKLAEKKNEKNSGPKLDNRDEVIFFPGFNDDFCIISAVGPRYLNYTQKTVMNFSNSIFHPPSTLAVSS